MAPQYYVIPWAAVSLNDAYATRWGQARRFLVPTFKKFKELVKEVLVDQDGGKPLQAETYKCEYLFLYQEAELFNDAKPKSRSRLYADPLYSPIDISNLFKMVEDALFDHLNQGWDHRVTDLIGRKRCVKTLPVPIERYTDDVLGRLPAGNILIRIEASDGMLLNRSDVAYRRFEPALKGAKLLAEREGTKQMQLPEYLELPVGNFSSVRIDPMDEWREWAAATTDRKRFGVLRAMMMRRVAWLAAWRDQRTVDDIALKLFNKDILNISWRELVGSRPQPAAVRGPKVQLFDASWAWVYESLRRECTTSSMLRMGQLAGFAERLGKGKRVALIGSAGGTWIYPFAAYNHRVTVFELATSPLSRCVSRRNQQNYLGAKIHAVDSYDDFRSEGHLDGENFDVVVCLDILDRLQKPEGLAPRLLVDEAELVITSFTFKDRRGKKVRKQRPWVHTEYDSMPDPKAALRKLFLEKRRQISYKLASGYTWAKDLLPLERVVKTKK